MNGKTKVFVRSGVTLGLTFVKPKSDIGGACGIYFIEKKLVNKRDNIVIFFLLPNFCH